MSDLRFLAVSEEPIRNDSNRKVALKCNNILISEINELVLSPRKASWIED